MTNALLLTALGLTLALPLVHRALRHEFDPFEPVVVFVVAYGTMFLLRPAAMILTHDLEYVRPTRTIPVGDTLPTVLWIALLGALAFIVAYMLPQGRRLAGSAPAPPAQFATHVVIVAALAAAAVGVLGFGIYLVSVARRAGISGVALYLAGRSSVLMEAQRSTSAYVRQSSLLLIPASLVLLAVGRAVRRPAVLLAGAAASAVLLLVCLPTGTRIMLMPFFGGALVYHYTSARTRPRTLALVAVGLVALVGSAVILNMRDSKRRQAVGVRSSVLATLTSPTRIMSPILAGSDNEMAPALAAVLRFVPGVVPHTWGAATLGDLLRRPVPRQLWPEKPPPPREQIIATLWPAEYSVPGRKSANPEFSILLYLYLDLGVVGVGLGMAAFGLVARFGYEYFRRHEDSTFVRLLFALAVPYVVIALRDSPVDTLNGAAFVHLPAWLMFRVAARRPARRRVRRRVPFSAPRLRTLP